MKGQGRTEEMNVMGKLKVMQAMKVKVMETTNAMSAVGGAVARPP